MLNCAEKLNKIAKQSQKKKKNGDEMNEKTRLNVLKQLKEKSEKLRNHCEKQRKNKVNTVELLTLTRMRFRPIAIRTKK